jgi:hypothetical protein
MVTPQRRAIAIRWAKTQKARPTVKGEPGPRAGAEVEEGLAAVRLGPRVPLRHAPSVLLLATTRAE